MAVVRGHRGSTEKGTPASVTDENSGFWMFSSLNWEKWNKVRLSRRQFICQGDVAKLVLFVESTSDWTWRLWEEGEKRLKVVILLYSEGRVSRSGNFGVWLLRLSLGSIGTPGQIATDALVGAVAQGITTAVKPVVKQLTNAGQAGAVGEAKIARRVKASPSLAKRQAQVASQQNQTGGAVGAGVAAVASRANDQQQVPKKENQ